MLLSISNGTVYFGSHELFSNIQFTINEHEKLALIGRNGSGKTTLLRVITGEQELLSGDVFRNRGAEISYLRQHAFVDETRTVLEEFHQVFFTLREKEKVLHEFSEKLKTNYSDDMIARYSQLQEEFRIAGGYDYENEIKIVFQGFGFCEADLKRPLFTFSGGEKTKIAFAQLLLRKPDLLLLDEPTNHLDLKTIEWLEGYLANYKKAMLIVSHDRIFLDKTVNGVYELEFGNLKRYNGNYSAFVEQKKKDADLQLRAYKRQQKDIRRLEDIIEKFRYKRSKASFAQSKIKFLDRMEKIDDPQKADTKTFKAKFKSRLRGGKDVLILDRFCAGYNEKLCEVTLNIHRGDRVCVMGDNGSGKSTLLRTIIGQIPALSGYMMLGHQIEIGYFEQNLNRFHPEKTVIEELWDDFPQLDRQQIRDVLGAFLFSSDEVFKEVSVLSGGEKVRLSFAKLMLLGANFLILDEPTNHLDILGKEALENALRDYDGTILFVSHDRYFIKQIATSCLVLDGGETRYYPDGYLDYIDQMKPNLALERVKEIPADILPIKVKPKSKYDLRKIEARVAALEEKLEIKRNLRFEPEYYQNSIRMQELDQEIDEIHNQLHHALAEWEEAMAEDEAKNK